MQTGMSRDQCATANPLTLGLMEGATEHSAVVQALIDDLIERGLDPAVPRLFIIDGSKALAKAIRRSFGRHTPIQRFQIHTARNIMERLSPALHGMATTTVRWTMTSISPL
jgi:putative transposase